MYSNIPDQAEVLFRQYRLHLFQAACHSWIDHFELEHDQDNATVSCSQDARRGKWAIAKLAGDLDNSLACLQWNTLSRIIVEHITDRCPRNSTCPRDILTRHPSLLFFHCYCSP